MNRALSATAILVAIAVAGPAAAAASSTPAFDPRRVPQSVLTQLVRGCASEVNETTQAAIVAVESGGNSWAMHDDNDDRVYDPASASDAKRILRALLARNRAAYGAGDRGVDVGLAQINSSNFAALTVAPETMLDPCANLHASARIIVAAYVRERSLLARIPSRSGDQLALRRALQVYNSGRPSGDEAYVRAIFAAVVPAIPRAAAATSAIALARTDVDPTRGVSVRVGEPVYLRGGKTHEIKRARASAVRRQRDDDHVRLRSALFVHVDIAASPNAVVSSSSERSGASFVHAAPESTASPSEFER